MLLFDVSYLLEYLFAYLMCEHESVVLSAIIILLAIIVLLLLYSQWKFVCENWLR